MPQAEVVERIVEDDEHDNLELQSEREDRQSERSEHEPPPADQDDGK